MTRKPVYTLQNVDLLPPLVYVNSWVKAEIQKNIDNQEHFIAQYLAATGAKIEETTLVQQHLQDGTARYWCEPKPRLELAKEENTAAKGTLHRIVNELNAIAQEIARLLAQVEGKE